MRRSLLRLGGRFGRQLADEGQEIAVLQVRSQDLGDAHALRSQWSLLKSARTSGVWKFSTMQQSARPVAASVPLSMWQLQTSVLSEASRTH